MIVKTSTADHYQWGANCDGWHLVKTPALSVIEERMPPGTSEVRHSHVHAHQFFYVLEGELTLEVEQQVFVLKPGDGIEVAPAQRHQAMNSSGAATRMLVTSQPPSHGDRVNA